MFNYIKITKYTLHSGCPMSDNNQGIMKYNPDVLWNK